MKSVVVTTPIKKVYLKPEKSSETSDELLYGMIVDILYEVNEEWIYIRTKYNYRGYITRKNLLFNNEKVIKWKDDSLYNIINNFADILENPKIQSKRIICIPKGALICFTGVTKENGTWSKVRLADGISGWVKSNFIRKVRKLNINESNFRNNLIEDAYSYIGTQYRWGGKSPEGIDCSGLCSMVYMLNGVFIFRDAQIKEGFPIKEIPIKNILKGDLLFFPNHVAMYLGNNKYIHSSDKNNIVKINSLDPNDDLYIESLAKTLLKAGSIY